MTLPRISKTAFEADNGTLYAFIEIKRIPRWVKIVPGPEGSWTPKITVRQKGLHIAEDVLETGV